MGQANRGARFLSVAFATALLASGFVAGCGPKNNAALERARVSYQQAQQNPDITTYAPAALDEAKEALNRAEVTWESTSDQEEVAHLSHVVEQKVEIARASAQEKKAAAEVQRLTDERERALLEARTREAEQARLSARAATERAQEATTRASALEQELAALQARETERGVVMTLQEDVLFEFDKADLKPGAVRNLDPLVSFLKEHPNRTLLIEGHTDSLGSDSYNADLSRRRAEAVRYFLVQNGISPERILARGYGEDYPVTSNDTEAGRQQNRRVEIIISHEGQRVAERRP